MRRHDGVAHCTATATAGTSGTGTVAPGGRDEQLRAAARAQHVLLGLAAVSVHPEVQVSTSGQRFQFRTGVLNTGKWLGNGYTSDCSGSDCWSDSSGFSQSSNSSHG